MNCENCGAPLNENNFCIRCGAGNGVPTEKGINQQLSEMKEDINTLKRRTYEESELVYGKPDFGMKFHIVYVVLLGLHLFIGFLDGINLHIGYILFIILTTLLLFLRKKIGYIFNIVINIVYLLIGILSFVAGITLITKIPEYKVIFDILTKIGLYSEQGLYMLIFGLVITFFSFYVMKYYEKRKIVFN